MVKKFVVELGILVALLPLCSHAANPADASKPAKGIDAIAAYAGVWKVEIDHLAAEGSKASHESTTLHNECWKSGAYFACNQYVNGESKILLVFTFDEKGNVYTSYQIPQGGGDVGSGKLMIDGNTWTFPWQVTNAGRTMYFRVVNVFLAPDRIDFRQEFSSDQKDWTVTAKGLETRTASE